jgi:hypothetical protein
MRRPRLPPEEVGPHALVWRRLRRLPIDARNELRTVELGPDGRVAIPCGGTVHHASVSADGDLVLHDHDVDSELAVLALGGALPACLVPLAVWHHAGTDPAFLLAWGDDVEDDELRAAREDWEGNYWESWPAEPPAARVLFGPRLQRELAMTAARRAAADARAGRFDGWAGLQRATQARARRAFVRSLAAVDAHPRPDALVPVRIGLDLDGGRGAVSGRLARLGSAVTIVVPVDWLWTVWRPGLDLGGGGRFVLARTPAREVVVAWRPTGRDDREHVPYRVVRPTASSQVTAPASQGAALR